MITIGILSATAAAFVVSAAYYGVVAEAPGSETMPQRSVVATALVELGRNLIVAALVAGLLAATDWAGLGDGLLLGLSLWTLPVVLLAGSVFHEGVPMRRAALHSVDWLIKLVIVGSLVGLFI